MNIIGGARKHWDIIIWGHYYFSDKQQFIHTFPYKNGWFLNFQASSACTDHVESEKLVEKKTRENSRGLFQTTTETKSEQLFSAVHW